MKKIIYIICIIITLLIAWAFIGTSRSNIPPNDLFKSLVINKDLMSLKNLQVIQHFRPTFGDGGATLQFNVDDNDFKKILKVGSFIKEEQDNKETYKSGKFAFEFDTAYYWEDKKGMSNKMIYVNEEENLYLFIFGGFF